MNEKFPMNRFDFSKLIESIQEMEELPKTIIDSKTGIEFYIGNNISKNNVVHFLKNFNILDNLAQNDARQEYEKNKQLGAENFQFEPTWAEINNDRIIVGYVGIYINTDFDLTFTKSGDQWKIIK